MADVASDKKLCLEEKHWLSLGVVLLFSFSEPPSAILSVGIQGYMGTHLALTIVKM